MHPTINQCYLLLVCWLFSVCIKAQIAQPIFRHYTPDHGLLSSECYDLIQDGEGYIWISTDNGISRFNGYEFENFGPEQGLKNNVVLYMQEDHSGNIWMVSLSGNVYIYQGDTIKAYPYNDLLPKDKPHARVTDFWVDSTENFYASIERYGFIKIDRNGNYQLIGDSLTYIDRIYSIPGQKVLYSRWQDKMDCCQIEEKGEFSTSRIVFIENDEVEYLCLESFYPLRGKLRDNSAWLLHEGILFNRSHLLFFLKNSTIDWSIPFRNVIISWYQSAGGEIVLGFLGRDGAYQYDNLDSLKNGSPSRIYLEGFSVSHILKDTQNGRWFATNEAGIFYSANPKIEVFAKSTGFSDFNIRAIAIKNGNEIFAGLDNGEVSMLDFGKGKSINLSTPFGEKELFDLHYDFKYKVLIKGTNPLQYQINHAWKLVKKKDRFGDWTSLSSKKIFPSQDPNRIWFSISSSFYRLNLLDKKIDFYCGSSCSTARKVFSVHEDYTHRIWLGRIDGLHQFYEQDTTLRAERSHPAFSLRVEDIQQMADSTLVVGTKGGGIVLWKDSSYLQISEKDGLTASMIENIHIDSAQHIWVGTLNGLNKITRYSQDSFFIKSYTTANGLPSNEINDIDSWGTDVWVATTRGLVKLPDTDEINRVSPAPRLEKVLVNGAAVDPKLIQALPYNQNNLEINLLTINYKLNGKINYRYRLSKNDVWNSTQNRQINFPKLPPADYFFEVQSQNEDGIWSDSTIWQFQVTPPFWQRWWFLTLVAAAVMGVAYLFYHNRVRLLEEETKNQRERAERFELEKELNELERAALRAQMNPHFLSNCLNSIQGFISKGEKMKAMQYLSEFNDLLRETLEISQAQLVPLEEDINLLKSYLNLEKMRFDHKFDYEIEIDEKVDIFTTEIPPLLIQPFVENAIVHAFPKEVNEPRIHITYAQNNDALLVTVMDNGIGIAASQARKVAGVFGKRRSFGMEIPQKRLNMMSNTAKTVQVEELKDEQGAVQGTKVTIRIAPR